MIDYLEKYLTSDELDEIKKNFNKDILSNFEIMKENVLKVLDYFRSLGLSNFKNVITVRPDLLFSDVSFLKTHIEKYDSDLLKFVIENDPDNLINLDI